MISHATTPRLASSLSRPLLRSPPAVAVAPLLGARAYASSNNGNKMSRDHTSLGGSYISASDSLAAAGATRTHASMGLAGAPAGEGPPAPHTIGDAIIADHKRLFAYYDQLKGSGLSHGQREHLRHLIVHDLSVHSLAEEEVLYPALKSAFGKDIRDHVLDEHTALKHILKDIDKMGADNPAFESRLDHLYRELRHHVAEEEERVLPQFNTRMPVADQKDLAERFEKAKHRVPTRPHTMAPDKPATGNVIVDRMTAPIDKLRDRAAGRDVA